jgi:hypothetical protein
MTHRKHLTAGLIAIGISASLSSIVSAAPEAPANFHIMDAQEVTAHIAAMKGLEGSAREEYRNSHYAELQERARRQGYQLPADPPWAAKTAGNTARTNPSPTMPIAPAPVDAPGRAPRIDIQAPRAAATHSRFAAGDMQPGASADTSDAMTAYREAMRARFDQFMHDRRAQYEEELRRQREHMAAARRQNRPTQQPLPRDAFQPPRYPGMPVWAPPYPMAFPGYREHYPEQR